jgi:transcriptional regulator with XRE-family HTH domain
MPKRKPPKPPTPQQVAVGRRIGLAWKSAGFETRAEFGRVIGVAPETICRYEVASRAPRAETLLRIADATGATLSWLIAGRGVGPKRRAA